jgi:hypothetical protein
MVATISFGAIAEWVIGSFTAGLIAGFILGAYMMIRLNRKDKK